VCGQVYSIVTSQLLEGHCENAQGRKGVVLVTESGCSCKNGEKLNCRQKERLQASTTIGKGWDEKSEPAYSETKATDTHHDG